MAELHPSRPNSCPNCGTSCIAHTGTYCHDCGESLNDDASRQFVDAFARHVNGTVTESEFFYTVTWNQGDTCAASD